MMLEDVGRMFAVVVCVSCLLSGCASFESCLFSCMVDGTAWLDFQHESDETKILLGKDRIGMTKAELLAELAEVEYAWLEKREKKDSKYALRAKNGWGQDFLLIGMMFPSNVIDCVTSKMGQEVASASCRIVAHSHGAKQCLGIGAWVDDGSGCQVKIYPRQWGLSTKSDFDAFLSGLKDPEIGSMMSDKDAKRCDIPRMCLNASCCWLLYVRPQVGPNWQWFGCQMYDALVVEFDASGVVVKQDHLTWGLGDG